MKEVLLIHATEDQKGSQAIAWTNLSRLHVSVTGKGNVTDIIQESIINILHFTLETLHNITPDFNENVQVATLLPHSQVKLLYCIVRNPTIFPDYNYKKKLVKI